VHLKVIYNPAAGRGRARRNVAAVEEILRGYGARVDCEPSTSAADLVRIAAESSRGGYDRVVVCGGDGTLNLAVREFDLAKGTLALVPTGSGDDFAKVTGIPRDIQRACEVVVRGAVREFDVATANGLRYLGVAGLGFDSEVADFANRNVRFLRGSAVYLYAILRVLPRFTPRPVEIRTELGGARQEEIMFAAIGNTRQYGGGIRITPDAQPDDGLLDLCVVHRTTRVELLKTLPKAYTGAHVNSPFVEMRRGKEFHFASEIAMAVYADGEPLTRTPVSFALAEGKLKVMVPSSRA
jgi:diacylglycerol kinase (ATP)